MNKDKILRALDDILDDLAYEADHAESSSSKKILKKNTTWYLTR